MPSPTKYIPLVPYRDSSGRLIIGFAVDGVDPVSEARIAQGWPAVVASLPVRGWFGALRLATILLGLFVRE